MESMVKKYQLKFKKVREQMDLWNELQARLLSQFKNAFSIIERLQVIQDRKFYGNLKYVDGIEDAVLLKQTESLERILSSANKTMEEFHRIVLSLEKIVNDGRQLMSGGGSHQLRLRIGVKPCIADCIDGLVSLHEMHHSEYLLKISIVSALPRLAIKPKKRSSIKEQPQKKKRNCREVEMQRKQGLYTTQRICCTQVK